MCRICWSADRSTDIVLSGVANVRNSEASRCCGYGADGKDTNGGYDCIHLPGAAFATANMAPVINNERCGGATDGTTAITTCCEYFNH